MTKLTQKAEQGDQFNTHRLIQEAELDDRFSTQLKKVQNAISQLDDILDAMQAPGSMQKPTATQRMQLRYAAEDLKRLHEKSQ